MSLRQRIHRRTYPLRVSSMALGGLVVGTAMTEMGASPAVWGFVLVSALVWPHIAFLHARHSRDSHRAEHANLQIDALIIGSWIPVMHFCALPSIALLAISIADRNHTATRDGWLQSLVATLLAAALVALLLRPVPDWEASLAVQLSMLPLLLLHSVFSSWSTRQLVRKLARQNVKLQVLSRIDPLTTLYSRDYWWQKARAALRDYRQTQASACLLIVDIDHFKRINDSFGHTVGDEVLQAIGLTIRHCLRSHDAAGRYGGDEFAVLCMHTQLDDAYAVALRIRNQLSQLRVREHPQLRVSASIGVAAADPSFLSVKDWINAADSALYSAKDAGRDQVIPAAPLMAGSAPARAGTGSDADPDTGYGTGPDTRDSRPTHQPEPDDTLI
ncbi:diguanylate cyclase [Delftia acidovorans]|uniref:sensor domain-containing diguanylate cyclase n=1 Tax=Delftia acidovorans TaxID=80866 RepID=UPI0018E7B4E6|nr:sensor domain-containing diguanylate cyclase [Delftia acidovorans]MBJ2143250.1 diguanylate cyclase [Delftia acidovorans]